MSISTLLPLLISIYRLTFTVCISLILAGFIWSLWQAASKGLIYVRKLHQIPCPSCAFFTDEYNLKCTVHPCKVLREEAIDCLDYESISV